MEQLLCAIYDRITQDKLGPVMEFKSEVVALRQWNDICTTENSAVRLHINDYEFWQIAKFNTETLEVTPEKKLLISGAHWAALQQNAEKA